MGTSWHLRSPIILVVAIMVLGACAGRSGAPVTDKATPLRQPESEYREVIAGDTLYSIAWESGRDYRELANWNQLSPPYTIKPGQKIRLHAPAATAASAPAKRTTAAPTAHTVQRGETLFGIATRYDIAVSDLAAWNNIPAPHTIKPGQTLRIAASNGAPPPARVEKKSTRNSDTPAIVTPTKPPAPAVSNAKAATQPIGTWTWPADGNVLTRFNSGGAKGIDVGGKPGQAITAAAPGTVVYQGSGLRGYGQLIIVKHNADFLSAYAHCDKIVVREGNVVKRGQKIAEMGSTGADRVKLHFEIRYRGTPVDPLDHLPKR